MTKRAKDRIGVALIVASLAGFALMAWAAYLADKANGISVGQSLAAWGL